MTSEYLAFTGDLHLVVRSTSFTNQIPIFILLCVLSKGYCSYWNIIQNWGQNDSNLSTWETWSLAWRVLHSLPSWSFRALCSDTMILIWWFWYDKTRINFLWMWFFKRQHMSGCRVADVIWCSPILSVWRKKTVLGFPSINRQWISLIKR